MGYLIAAAVIFLVGFGSGYSSGTSSARRRAAATVKAVRDILR
jgi:hypothetical protein